VDFLRALVGRGRTEASLGWRLLVERFFFFAGGMDNSLITLDLYFAYGFG